MQKTEFLHIAALLNNQLGAIPLLYGSLGLEQRLRTNLHADDIDVLISAIFLNEKWDKVVAIMKDAGYVLYDLHEHEFKKSGLSIAFAAIESLTTFAGIDLAQIPIIEEVGVRYYLLDLQDYLKVYMASSKDGYRKNTKNKKDEEKIKLIKKALCKRKGITQMRIETDRLIITEFTLDMAEAVHLNSLDEDNRRFVPDEVFETVEEAADTVEFLMRCYVTGEGPLVYPVLLKDGTYIGYVQVIALDNDTWEVGYHIGGNYTKQGYATEAVKAFLPVIMPMLGITQVDGICLSDNKGSIKVMERCGFIKVFEGIGLYQGEERNICKFMFSHTVDSGYK